MGWGDTSREGRHRRIIAAVAAVGLLAAGIFTATLSVLAAPEDWTTTVVDGGASDVGRSSAIAVDAAGHPHIGFFDATAGDLRYARHDGSAWTIETVDSEGTAGDFVDLVLDTDDRPHLSYYDASDPGIRYAVRADTGWTTTTVDSIEGGFTSIAIAADGAVHMSYWDTLASDLKHAEGRDGTWTITTVASEGLVGTYTSLALDAAGEPAISYFNGSLVTLDFARRAGGAWTVESVDATGTSGIFTSLAFDPDGHAHISYFDIVAQDLRYATNGGGSWTATVVDEVDSTGWYSAIDVDGTGAHIAYYNNTTMDLSYARRTDDGWILSTVDVIGTVGLYPSIALDNIGVPHISYHDLTNGTLKHATSANSDLDVTIALDSYNDLDNSADISVGDTVFYTITATNNGVGPLTGVVLTDELTGQEELCISPLPVDASCSMVADYTVQPGDVGTVLSSTGIAASDRSAPVAEVIEVSVPTPAIDLDVDAFLIDSHPYETSPDEDPSDGDLIDVAPGDLVGFTATAHNSGDANLTDVVVDATLTAPGGSTTTASTTCPLVEPGDVCTLVLDHLVTDADADGTVDVAATTVSVQAGPADAATSVHVVAPVKVEPPTPLQPALSLVIEVVGHGDVDGSETVTPGDDVHFAIIATNTGGVDLTGVRVRLKGAELGTICSDPLVPGAECQLVSTVTITVEDVGTVRTVAAGAVAAEVGMVTASLHLDVEPSGDPPEGHPDDPPTEPSPPGQPPPAPKDAPPG